MNKNTKIILITILAILALFGAGLTGYVLGAKENKQIENIEQNDEESKENAELNQDQKTAFELLLEYGKDIYNKEIYITLEKNEEGILFANLEDLEKLGYDITSLDGKCHKTYTGIHFDIENKLVEKYDAEPINISINCNNDLENTENNNEVE